MKICFLPYMNQINHSIPYYEKRAFNFEVSNTLFLYVLVLWNAPRTFFQCVQVVKGISFFDVQKS